MNAAALERCVCPLCGGAAGRVEYRLAPYEVVACAGCGLRYLSPRLPEAALLERYAAEDYFNGGEAGYADYAAQEPALRATFRRFLGALERSSLAGGDLLEVGCARGWLLDEARGLFRRRAGTEFSAAAAQAARALADEVWQGGVEALPEEERFDCIVALQVVEHCYDPVGFVRRLAGHLKPGGTVILATPDYGSAWRRLMGVRWPSFKLPEHVLYFDRRTLAQLFRTAGLGAVAWLPFPHAFPLPLIASKLGMRIERPRVSLWLPATTLAACAKRDG